MKLRYFFFITLCATLSCSSNLRERFNMQIGTYVLDTARSSFDSTNLNPMDYIDLKLTLYPDSTFLFSRSVPFIWDSSGTWYVEGGLYDFAYFNYTKLINGNKATSMFYGYNPKLDDAITMSGTTPQIDTCYMQFIYFIKVDSGAATPPTIP